MASKSVLNGKIAIVTGGGGGIGKEICSTFATNGASVVICDINEKAANETLASISGCNKHLAKAVDVSNPNSVNKLLLDVMEKLGIPHILVNCAGIKWDAPLIEMTEQMFDKVLQVNLKGTFLMTQAVSKLMVDNKVTGGSIINFSSVAATYGFKNQVNYASSKAGIEGLTKVVARELGPHGIRCNAIRPGVIETSIIADIPQNSLDTAKTMTPLQRHGKPEEIADVVKFLASDESSFMTGAVVQASGGLFMS